MSNWKTTVKGSKSLGVDVVLAHLKKNAPESVLIETRFGPSSGRTANQNAKIAGIQKAAGRNPWFAPAKDMTRLNKIFREAIKSVLAGGSKRKLLDAAGKIGEGLLKIYKSNIDQGRNPRGTFTPLTRATAIRKAKKHGTKKPILVDTGQLLRSVYFKVTKL